MASYQKVDVKIPREISADFSDFSSRDKLKIL